MRQVLSTAAIAVIVSLLTLTVAGAMAQAGSATDEATPSAVRARNADRVDGKHAVAYTNKRGVRAGKLVATNARGLLPSNIVQPYWGYIKNKPGILADHQIAWNEVANKPGAIADGQIAWNEVAGMPAGFADNVDNAGVTKVKVVRVESELQGIIAGSSGAVEVSCPTGTVVIGGGGTNSGLMKLVDSYSTGNAWRVYYRNDTVDTELAMAVAHCLSVQPEALLETAGKRRTAVPAGKR